MCRECTAHHPSADVTYEPGTDQYGRPVAPADIEGTPQLNMPETTSVQITVDQAAVLGLPPGITYRPEAYIGEVTVMKSGDVYCNGKRVSQPQLQALCDQKSKNTRTI